MIVLSLLLLMFVGTGCGEVEPATYFYGYDLNELKTYSPQDDTEGVYPSSAVLSNPQNPFSQIQPNATTKWDLESSSSLTVAFYGWSSILVYEPTGEHQYYAANKLKGIYQKEECAPEDLETVREMAIKAYESVLTNFPTSISYLADGETSFPLAPLAEQALNELEGGSSTDPLSGGETP